MPADRLQIHNVTSVMRLYTTSNTPHSLLGGWLVVTTKPSTHNARVFMSGIPLSTMQFRGGWKKADMVRHRHRHSQIHFYIYTTVIFHCSIL